MLRALEKETKAPAFSARYLFDSSIREQVAALSQQTPKYAPIPNSGAEEGGDFVFIRKTSPSLPGADYGGCAAPNAAKPFVLNGISNESMEAIEKTLSRYTDIFAVSYTHLC